MATVMRISVVRCSATTEEWTFSRLTMNFARKPLMLYKENEKLYFWTFSSTIVGRRRHWYCTEIHHIDWRMISRLSLKHFRQSLSLCCSTPCFPADFQKVQRSQICKKKEQNKIFIQYQKRNIIIGNLRWTIKIAYNTYVQ